MNGRVVDGTYNNNNDNNSQVGLNQDKLTSSSLIVIHIHPKPSVHFTPFPSHTSSTRPPSTTDWCNLFASTSGKYLFNGFLFRRGSLRYSRCFLCARMFTCCLLAVVEEEEDTQTAIELEQQQHIPSNVI